LDQIQAFTPPSGGNFASFNATNSAITSNPPMNNPIPFHPPKCQNTPPAVPAMLYPA
jgi:cytochrome b561